VGGESDDTGISGPRLGQDRDSPVRGRELARGDVPQEGGKPLAPRRITHRLEPRFGGGNEGRAAGQN
jgi:hypothetical protein